MAYVRKTRDEYEIHSNYGYGFEYTCGAEDYADAKRLVKEYRENQPEYGHRIVKCRVKIEKET